MIDIRIGNCYELIKMLLDRSIDCLVTSPPYYGLRDYGTEPIVFDGIQNCEHKWVETRSGLVHENDYKWEHRVIKYRTQKTYHIESMGSLMKIRHVISRCSQRID